MVEELPSGSRLPSRYIIGGPAAVLLVLCGVVAFFVIRSIATGQYTVFKIEGSSMEPAYHAGQSVLIARYDHDPARGDVIVLKLPNDPSQELVKRIIGLPGEKVEIKQGRVYINGALLDEPYITKFCTAGCDGIWQLGADQYFVLGDNRGNSYDSHAFGPIAKALIVAKVVSLAP